MKFTKTVKKRVDKLRNHRTKIFQITIAEDEIDDEFKHAIEQTIKRRVDNQGLVFKPDSNIAALYKKETQTLTVTYEVATPYREVVEEIQEYESAFSCPDCGSETFYFIGHDDDYTHLRCSNCKWDGLVE